MTDTVFVAVKSLKFHQKKEEFGVKTLALGIFFFILSSFRFIHIYNYFLPPHPPSPTPYYSQFFEKKLERKTQAARIPCVTYTVDYLGMDCKVGEIILYTQKEVVL